MRRGAVVLAAPPRRGVAPPGIDDSEYAQALVEDTYEAVEALAQVETAEAETMVAVHGPEAWRAQVAGLLWPSTPLLEIDGTASPDAAAVLRAALPEAPDADEVTLIAGDMPDLPDVVVAQVFSALSSAPVAAAPALRG